MDYGILDEFERQRRWKKELKLQRKLVKAELKVLKIRLEWLRKYGKKYYKKWVLNTRIKKVERDLVIRKDLLKRRH